VVPFVWTDGPAALGVVRCCPEGPLLCCCPHVIARGVTRRPPPACRRRAGVRCASILAIYHLLLYALPAHEGRWYVLRVGSDKWPTRSCGRISLIGRSNLSHDELGTATGCSCTTPVRLARPTASPSRRPSSGHRNRGSRTPRRGIPSARKSSMWTSGAPGEHTTDVARRAAYTHRAGERRARWVFRVVIPRCPEQPE